MASLQLNAGFPTQCRFPDKQQVCWVGKLSQLLAKAADKKVDPSARKLAADDLWKGIRACHAVYMRTGVHEHCCGNQSLIWLVLSPQQPNMELLTQLLEMIGYPQRLEAHIFDHDILYLLGRQNDFKSNVLETCSRQCLQRLVLAATSGEAATTYEDYMCFWVSQMCHRVSVDQRISMPAFLTFVDILIDFFTDPVRGRIITSRIVWNDIFRALWSHRLVQNGTMSRVTSITIRLLEVESNIYGSEEDLRQLCGEQLGSNVLYMKDIQVAEQVNVETLIYTLSVDRFPTSASPIDDIDPEFRVGSDSVNIDDAAHQRRRDNIKILREKFITSYTGSLGQRKPVYQPSLMIDQNPQGDQQQAIGQQQAVGQQQAIGQQQFGQQQSGQQQFDHEQFGQQAQSFQQNMPGMTQPLIQVNQDSQNMQAAESTAAETAEGAPNFGQVSQVGYGGSQVNTGSTLTFWPPNSDPMLFMNGGQEQDAAQLSQAAEPLDSSQVEGNAQDQELDWLRCLDEIDINSIGLDWDAAGIIGTGEVTN